MKYYLRNWLFAAVIGTTVCILAILPVNNATTSSAFHTPEELQRLQFLLHTATIDSTQYFPTSTLCITCHSYDPEGYALVDGSGNDVNMSDDWRATMMANSAKDPFWRAKVSHEILLNPDHSLETQDKCNSCHAPMGHFTAHLKGDDFYTIDDLLADTIGLDGVSCGACHQIRPDSLAIFFSGKTLYDTNRVAFGPYPTPFAAPMTDFVGFTPEYSEHILDPGICASCHTLITSTFDLDGQPTGGTFVEQATYHEWLNSNYNTDDVSCQACHMPQIEDSVIISDNYNILDPRFPYGLHELVGGNVFMLNLMKNNRLALGITAEEAHYDETIASTIDMLQQRTLDLELNLTDQTLDSLFLTVHLQNKAGHKFPSGYPSRRAFIELLVVTPNGDTIFQSGILDNDFEVLGHDPHFEPHYDVINDPNQVQIYEIIPADVKGNFTSVLERAAYPLKDNRLVPTGFSVNHSTYDTTFIAGNALTDANFNYENGNEGSGSDRVSYHVPRADYEGGYVNISARVYYQSLPPKWMEEIFSESTPEIESFKTMYYQTDQTPTLVAEALLDSIWVETIINTEEQSSFAALLLTPNPTPDGWLNCRLPDGHHLLEIQVFDVDGRLLQSHRSSSFRLPEKQGIYVIRISSNLGQTTRKIVRR